MRLIDKDALLEFERFDAQIEEHTSDDILMIIKTAPAIDPIKAAGGCYCRECRFAQPSAHTGSFICTGYDNSNNVADTNGCLQGEPRKAQDDG